MSESVNIHYAKTHLSRLLKRVREGAEVIINSAGKPVARLVPIEQNQARKPGGYSFRLGPKFFAALPEEELEPWEQ